jgi:hypothetical protein
MLAADEEDDFDWNSAEIAELSSRNSELEKRLKQQSLNQERDMEEFETLKADWVSEKEALENTLLELRQKLKERETTLSMIDAQKVNCEC